MADVDISVNQGVSVTESTDESIYGKDNLVGTWTSATYDLNAIEVVRIWGDFLTVFESGATTWGGIGADIKTWSQMEVDTKTWREIFQPTDAAQLRATLRYKQDSGEAWSETDFFEILCAEVKARYISIVVQITDPTEDSRLYLEQLNVSIYEGPQE